MDRDDKTLIQGMEKNKRTMMPRSERTVFSFRWAVMLIVLFYPFISPREKNFILFETMAIAVVYNIIVTLYTLKSRKNNIKIHKAVIYADIFLIAVFSLQLGGIESDLYVLFFFMIGYCGILNSLSTTLKTGLFTVAVYTASCLFAARLASQEPDYARLVIKDILLMLATIGISYLNHEVKKYNELHKREFRLARMDKLTGLANRHYFDQKIREELEYADFSGSPLNILLFDLDNFKQFNDTYGHSLGDELLVLFSGIIKQNIRKSDIPVRYGGEEFLILIRDLDIYIARSVGERIRKQLEKQQIYVGEGEGRGRVTVSCGIAQYPVHSKDIRKVIECADIALYQAKRSGKNTIVLYDEVHG